MREIEIKARLANRRTVITALTDKGLALSDPVVHHDRVFGPPNVNGNENNNAAWLRVRTEIRGGSERHLLTLKQSVTNQLDSIEHETVVENAEETLAIIERIGYVPFSDITKTRTKVMSGDIEICLDTVDGLGDFIEAEKLTHDEADYDTVADELWQLFISLGISKGDEVTDGYDVLVNKQKLAHQ